MGSGQLQELYWGYTAEVVFTDLRDDVVWWPKEVLVTPAEAGWAGGRGREVVHTHVPVEQQKPKLLKPIIRRQYANVMDVDDTDIVDILSLAVLGGMLD